MTKEQYRRIMLCRRLGLGRDEAARASTRITRTVLENPSFYEFEDWAVYLPVRNEVDTRPILKGLMNSGKNVYVPRCERDGTGSMDFFRIKDFSGLEPGYCGIDEPCPHPDLIYVNNRPGLFLLPGLAFDRQGFRLGYGRGYYDRYLRTLPGPKPFLVGLGFAFQVVKHLPRDDWDIPADMIITDEELIDCS